MSAREWLEFAWIVVGQPVLAVAVLGIGIRWAEGAEKRSNG